jgi:hypothetical protein
VGHCLVLGLLPIVLFPTDDAEHSLDASGTSGLLIDNFFVPPVVSRRVNSIVGPLHVEYLSQLDLSGGVSSHRPRHLKLKII